MSKLSLKSQFHNSITNLRAQRKDDQIKILTKQNAIRKTNQSIQSMRKYILIAFTFMVHLQLNAQDVIIMKSGDKVEAIILEITTYQIKYRLYIQPDGPDRLMEKSRIMEIIYEDGQYEKFDDSTIVVEMNTYYKEKKNSDFFRTRNFIEATIGTSNVKFYDYKYFYDPTSETYMDGYFPDHRNFLQFGFKFGTQLYFGSSERFRSGFKINWIRMGVHMDLSEYKFDYIEDLLFLGPRTFSICNVGYAGLLKINENTGIEFNMVTGLGLNFWLDEDEFDRGINFSPEIKVNIKHVILGLEYKYYLGIQGYSDEPTRMQMLGVTIGSKFR